MAPTDALHSLWLPQPRAEQSWGCPCSEGPRGLDGLWDQLQPVDKWQQERLSPGSAMEGPPLPAAPSSGADALLRAGPWLNSSERGHTAACLVPRASCPAHGTERYLCLPSARGGSLERLGHPASTSRPHAIPVTSGWLPPAPWSSPHPPASASSWPRPPRRLRPGPPPAAISPAEPWTGEQRGVTVLPPPQRGGVPAHPRHRGSPGVPWDPHLEMLQLPPVVLELPPFVLDLRLTFPLLLEGRERQSRSRHGEGAPPSRPGQHPQNREEQGVVGEGLPGGLTWGHKPCLGLQDRPWGRPTGNSPALHHVPAFTGGN